MKQIFELLPIPGGNTVVVLQFNTSHALLAAPVVSANWGAALDVVKVAVSGAPLSVHIEVEPS